MLRRVHQGDFVARPTDRVARAEHSRNDYVPDAALCSLRYLKATLRQPEVSSSPERGEVYLAYLPVCL